MDTISVIMPVYNAEKYLGDALESVRKQTFQDWTCICVDDGSTDGSSLILDGFAARDSRFKVVHKQNEGCQKSRNLALGMIESPWFMFMDADDMYHPSAFEVLLEAAQTHNADMVTAGYSVHEDGLRATGGSAAVYDKPIERMRCDKKFRGEPWGRIMRSSFFRQIEFVPGFRDDVKWVTSAILKAKREAVLDVPLYYWRQVPTSLSHRDDYYHALPELWRYQAKVCPSLKSRLGEIAYSYAKNKPGMVSFGLLKKLKREGVITFDSLSWSKKLKIALG